MNADLTTEVIGYRQWRVTSDLELRAAHKRKAVWATGVNVAECHKSNDYIMVYDDEDPPEPKRCKSAPGQDCECGIYALYSPDDFWYGKGGKAWIFGSHAEPDPLVSGVIVAWGEMEVHYSGFRAQYARAVALATPDSPRDAVIAKAVADRYGVPLVPANELPRIAAEFGIDVPETMRPPKPEKDDCYASIFSKFISGPLYTHTFTASVTNFEQASKNLKTAMAHFEKRAKQRPPSPVERMKRGKTYDPRMFLPKRNGGLL